jgi:glycosyltransferase involved in cell wall biosynthesis
MRIGYDGGPLANRRGFGRFSRELLRALGERDFPHELLVFVDRPSLATVEDAIPEQFQKVPVEVREAPSKAASAQGSRSLGDLLAMGQTVARAGLDLMFFPSSYGFFPVWNVRRVVVTMFDTLALAHPDLVFPNLRGRLLWRAKEQCAAWKADRILTTSEASKTDLRSWFRLPESKVGLIPAAPDPVFAPLPLGQESDEVLRRYRLDPREPFLLYVGGLSPHKNLLRLLEAFARISAPRCQSRCKLVLLGDTADVFHTHVPELRAAVDRLALGDRVVWTGFVPDQELAYLYNRAAALVQPSLMEGFGLPPVEAMACGTPVLSSTAGSLPEVVGEAGVYFDPTDVSGMARAMEDLLADPARRDALAQQALQRSRRFTWQAAAKHLLAEFEALNPDQAWRKSA